MAVKLFAAVVAIALVLIYLLPVVVKLKEIDLGIVILLGIAMMLVDLWQSLKKDD
jgi:hypothetical protein